MINKSIDYEEFLEEIKSGNEEKKQLTRAISCFIKIPAQMQKRLANNNNNLDEILQSRSNMYYKSVPK
jgi:hypothetical protein